MTSVMERCCASGAAIAAERAEEAVAAARQAAQDVRAAYDAAAEALTVAREAAKILDLTTTAHALESGEPPTVEYNKRTNIMDFGLPRGDPGPQGLPGPPPDFVGAKASADDLPELGEPGQGWFLENGDLYYWRPCASQWTYVGNFRGPAGADGASGQGLTISGSLSSTEELPASGGTGGWIIGGDLYVWDSALGTWKNVGRIQGDRGDQGDPGEPGDAPHIGANGNWWVGNTDTGVRAAGQGLRFLDAGAEAGKASFVIAPASDGDFLYVHPLGLYQYRADCEQPADGELRLASGTAGCWELLAPSMETVLAMVECKVRDAAITLTRIELPLEPGSIEARAVLTIMLPASVPAGDVVFSVKAPADVPDSIMATAHADQDRARLKLLNAGASAVTLGAGVWTILAATRA